MAIKVLIKRKVPKGLEKELSTLITQLRTCATKQAGYISGETMRNVERPDEYLVISTWQTLDDWNAWESSKKRIEIQEKVDTLLGKKTTYEVYHYPERRPVSLKGFRRWEGG
jgi:heme-degrading monooxygenase HmoA